MGAERVSGIWRRRKNIIVIAANWHGNTLAFVKFNETFIIVIAANWHGNSDKETTNQIGDFKYL